MRYLAAAAVALAAMAGWSAMMAQKGVQIERARVESTGKKIDAKAKVARKRAVDTVKAAPDPGHALRAWCRDC